MISCLPFIAAAGFYSEEVLTSATLSLSAVWDVPTVKFSVDESPLKVLNNLPKQECLFQLNGDPGKILAEGGSWLEAFGAWKKPLILVVMPLPNGDIPGSAAAYVALSKQLSVPLIGIFQFRGVWTPSLRRRDGLPWCGWIPERINENNSSDSMLNDYVQDLVNTLKARILFVDS